MLPSDDQKHDQHFVSEADLPVCCPPKDMPVWSQHPRVYLPIGEEGFVICPYCSAKYTLKADKQTRKTISQMNEKEDVKK